MTDAWKWFGCRWNDFWLAPRPARELGLFRAAFFGTLLLVYLPWNPAPWGDVPRAFWWPTPVFETLGLEPLGPGALLALGVAWKAALLSACLGLFTRTSAVVAFLLGFYLLGLPHGFAKVNHADAPLVLILFGLAFARSGDGFSLDRRWKGRGDGAGGGSAPAEADPGSGDRRWSGEYRWPVALGRVVFVLVFLAAGLAKLKTTGWSWVAGENMANLLVRHHYTHAPPTDWGLALAGMEGMPQLLARATLILELAAPLALAPALIRIPVVAGLLGAQLGIWLLLGVSFAPYLALYLVWVPWERSGQH